MVGVAASEDNANWDTSEGDIFSLVQLFDDHLLDGDANRAERQGYMGLTLPLAAGTYGGTVYSKGLLDVARQYNDPRLHIAGQTTQVIASNYVESILDPWAFALQVAGIQMGTPDGEPTTFKRVKTAALAQPLNDWDPLEPLDLKAALKGGILYGEPEAGFWRVVRGLTTHVATDNLARTDTSVWEIRNRIRRVLRSNVEQRFVGRGIGVSRPGVRVTAPANIASIREQVTTLMAEERAEGFIIDSQDEQGNFVNAWRALSVKITGDVGRIRLQVFPKTGLNFILIDVAFQIPTLSA